MIFLPPAFLLIFSLVFFSVWLLERGRIYLALLGIAFLLFSLAAFVQVAHLPADYGQNAVLSATLYTSATLCFSHGVLLRSGRHLSARFHALFFIVIISGITYYYYGEKNLFYRIYIINLGMGAIFLATAYQGRFLLRGRTVDKVLFWLLFGLGAHFFPRTILTAENIKTISALDFAGTPFWQALQFTITVAGVSMGVGLLAITFTDIIIDLRKERDTDPLTGLANRRLFSEHIKAKLREGVNRNKLPNKHMTFAMIDVDYFKLYNDLYGHDAGDIALKKVAKAISSVLQNPDDMAARVGGEEFALFFYDRTIEQTLPVLEVLREHIAALQIAHDRSPVSDLLTVSIGVAECKGGEDFESLFKRADRMLYSSKATGRDQITMA